MVEVSIYTLYSKIVHIRLGLLVSWNRHHHQQNVFQLLEASSSV